VAVQLIVGPAKRRSVKDAPIIHRFDTLHNKQLKLNINHINAASGCHCCS
jgi:hypothetical protein